MSEPLRLFDPDSLDVVVPEPEPEPELESVSYLEPVGDSLFGAVYDFSQPWQLRDIDHYTAAGWVDRYHYLGGMPSGASARLGAFCPDMIGAVVYANAANAFGVARKYGLEGWPGNLEIARVAVHPDAPANTTSKLVAAANAVVHDRFGLAWLFSYADTGQNHHGGIYQALNAVYVGLSLSERGYLLDGKPIHPRSVVAWLGTRKNATELARQAGRELVRVAGLNTAKHVYIIPIGAPSERAAIRRALKLHRRPYPKRAGGVEGTARPDPVGNAGSIPAPRLEEAV